MAKQVASTGFNLFKSASEVKCQILLEHSHVDVGDDTNLQGIDHPYGF